MQSLPGVRRVECTGVPCTATDGCSELELCDPRVLACFPADGSCQNGRCRPIPAEHTQFVSSKCEGTFCHADVVGPQAPEDNRAPVDINFVMPEPERILPPNAVVFRWAGLPAPVFLFVTQEAPAFMEDVTKKAIWADVARDGISSRTWSDGVDVNDGVWGFGPPRDPPLDTPLYVFAAAIERTVVTHVSRPTLFRVSGRWAEVCTDEGVVAGQCLHPSSPRVCSGGRCRRVCESHGDCNGDVCGKPNAPTLLRICGVP